MKKRSCIVLILFLFLLPGCAGMMQGSSAINNVRIGMTKSEVVATLGMKRYPQGSTSVSKYTTFEHWRLCWDWLNQYHECIGYSSSMGGPYRLMFENDKLANISN